MLADTVGLGCGTPPRLGHQDGLNAGPPQPLDELHKFVAILMLGYRDRFVRNYETGNDFRQFPVMFVFRCLMSSTRPNSN